MRVKEVATNREKVWLRLDRQLLLRTRAHAQAEYGDESKWREIVEDALNEYSVKRIGDTDLTALLSKTEQVLFDRLHDYIEQTFNQMSKKTINRVGNLIAMTSYDAALSAVMIEDLYKERHSKRYPEARRLAAERMKKRWEKEGADEIAVMIEEKKQAEEQADQLRQELERMKQEMKRKEQQIAGLERLTQKLDSEAKQGHKAQDQLSDLIQWTAGLLQQLESSSMMTSAKSALKEFEKSNSRPKVLYKEGF
jgi:hypothetical protein